jgi:hypothetical protein
MSNRTRLVTLLVLSCDKYADLWAPYLSVLDRYWPDRPQPLALVSNGRSLNRAGVGQILVGPDRSWSETLLAALESVTTEYVLLLLDDLFLIAPVDTAKVMANIVWLDRQRGNYLRLNPTPPPVRRVDADHGEAVPGSIYRTSVVLSVWRTSTLQSLLVPGETAWDFEIFGSVRSDDIGGFYASTRYSIPFMNGVVKGRWAPWAVQYLSRMGIEVDTSTRPVMGWWAATSQRLANARGKIYRLVPWRWRREIKGWTQPLRPRT